MALNEVIAKDIIPQKQQKAARIIEFPTQNGILRYERINRQAHNNEPALTEYENRPYRNILPTTELIPAGN